MIERNVAEEAEKILGVDLNQSLHHLIGYWYAYDTGEVFDEQLAIAMIEYCLTEVRNPVGIDHKEKLRLEHENKKLRVYMKSIAINTCCDRCQEASRWARQCLKELEK